MTDALARLGDLAAELRRIDASLAGEKSPAMAAMLREVEEACLAERIMAERRDSLLALVQQAHRAGLADEEKIERAYNKALCCLRRLAFAEVATARAEMREEQAA